MSKMPFSELGLSPESLKAVERMGYEAASPIQSESIPVLLGGADVFGQSQTGSGKTAAFALPAIERVDPSIRAPQVLILCPTRELAMQVADEVAKLAAFKRGVRELPIYGGASYGRQIRGLQEGAQIIIGTPGRVMDHLDRKSLTLNEIRMVVLDEADRMLDMGFRDDMESILKDCPPERQTVLFSATLPKAIKDLVNRFTRDPVHIRIEAQALTIPKIDQIYYEVDRRSKLEVLCRVIDWKDYRSVIVFCATKMMCDELAAQLSARGFSTDKLHGDVTQANRERVMRRFRERKFEILVATDVAARGLDVDDIDAVFNYDLPQDAEDYVHRIGRTGRAGKSGEAITFVSGRDIRKLESMIRLTKGRIRRERPPTLEQLEQKRADLTFEQLRLTLEEGKYTKRDDLVDRLLEQGYSPTDICSALLYLLHVETRRPDEPAPTEFGDQRERGNRRERGDDRGGRGDRMDRGEDRGGQRDIPLVSNEPGMTRLVFNVGRAQDVRPADIVGKIMHLCDLEKSDIGSIKIDAHKTYVDIADRSVEPVIETLNGIKIKTRRLRVVPAQPQ